MKYLSFVTVFFALVMFHPGSQVFGASEADEGMKVDAEAVEILKRAAVAMKGIAAVRYEARIEPGGIGETFWPRAEGSAILAGWSDFLRRPARFWIHIDTVRKGSEEVVPVTMGGDGDSFFVIDHGTRRGYEDMDPGVLGAHQQTLSRFEMTEFVLEDPYRDEIEANGVELVGVESFEGEDCYKIRVQYSAGRGEATWLLAVEDVLPRYRKQSFSIPQGEGSLAITFTDLKIDPRIEPGLFKMTLPVGYQQINDFAP